MMEGRGHERVIFLFLFLFLFFLGKGGGRKVGVRLFGRGRENDRDGKR